MHIVSLGAPVSPSAEEREGIRAFYESLQVVIPCPVCREHYKQALVAMPPRLQSRAELIEWVYEIHNYVNEQLGKPSLSWEGFIAHMQSLASGNGGNNSSNNSSGSIGTLLVGVGLGIGLTLALRPLLAGPFLVRK
jgi:hypothetical protein